MQIILDGARVLITGGDSGIGRATAFAFAEAGARVAINYVSDPESADQVVARLKRNGTEARSIRADVSDPEQVAGMFEELDDAWGGLDVLINNAGIDGEPGPGWEIDLEDWREVLEVNLFGAFHCCREALGRMVPRGSGTILNVTSVHETIPRWGHSAYTASKAGLSMLTRTLAQEAMPHGVRLVALAPGAIRTPINEDVREDPEGRRDLLSKIPAGRIGEPEEVARIAVILASEAASYVSGTTVFVDGGMTLYPDFGEDT